MPERLELLRAGRASGRPGSAWARRRPCRCIHRSVGCCLGRSIAAAAAASATTRVRPVADRIRLEGVSGSAGRPNARSTASALLSPVTMKTTSRRRRRAPGMVMRDALDERLERRLRRNRPALALLERRLSAERARPCGRPGRSRAGRSRAAPRAAARRTRAAASSAPSSPRIRCTSRGACLDPVEQLLAREQEVRALVVGRHAALVAPPERGARSSRARARRPARRRGPACCRR